MASVSSVSESRDFLRLLSDDLRWTIITILARGDHRVRDLVEVLRAPMNLVSYHLDRLRTRKIVTKRRSSADARDVYYSLNLDVLQTLYVAAGDALHPALTQPQRGPNPAQKSGRRHSRRVLFLCTHNSARSQMAEALLRHLGGPRISVYSAGSEPRPIHPLTLQTLTNLQVDARGQRPKAVGDFAGQRFDHVITVCDRVREVCPAFPGNPERIHWSIPDPASTQGGAGAQRRAFEETAQQLMTRIRYLLMGIERAA